MTLTTSRVTLLLVSLVLVAGLAPVQAQEDDQPLIEYRQKLMAGQRASMGSIADMMKFKLPFSAQHFAVHARNISEYAKLIPESFEKSVTAGPTDSKPEIWQNWDDFVAKANALSEASAQFAEAAAAGGEGAALMPHVKAVGDACRACHNDYRKPEEESFKRQ